MNPFDYLKSLEHHAYFIHAFNDSVDHLKEFLKRKFKINHTQNPDFYHEKFETLGINDSRKIKENHLSKSFEEGGKRIFIIEAFSITHEAQNSLLKIFEEPNTGSHFFLIMPSPAVLLPTLRSRLYIVEQNKDNQNTQGIKEANEFLKLSKKDRVAFVDELAKQISDEVLNKNDAQNFLISLEIALYKEKGLRDIKGLKAILKARDYLSDRSSSVKQLLEYVALSV